LNLFGLIEKQSTFLVLGNFNHELFHNSLKRHGPMGQ